MSTASRELTIVNRLGLHARAAAKLVNLASSFEAQVELGRGERFVDAKSIMGVLLLCAEQGAELSLRITGATPEEAEDAADAIAALVASGFGEDRSP